MLESLCPKGTYLILGVEMYKDEDIYATPDTSIAAYLHLIGIELLSVKARNGQGVFVFKNNSNIESLVEDFRNRRATVVARFYYESYRAMLSMVKEAMRETK